MGQSINKTIHESICTRGTAKVKVNDPGGIMSSVVTVFTFHFGLVSVRFSAPKVGFGFFSVSVLKQKKLSKSCGRGLGHRPDVTSSVCSAN